MHGIAQLQEFSYTDIAGMVFDRADIRQVYVRFPCQLTLAESLDFTQPAQAEADPAGRIAAGTGFLYAIGNILIRWHGTGLSWIDP